MTHPQLLLHKYFVAAIMHITDMYVPSLLSLLFYQSLLHGDVTSPEQNHAYTLWKYYRTRALLGAPHL